MPLKSPARNSRAFSFINLCNLRKSVAKYFLIVCTCFLLAACGKSSDNYVPKPKGFPRIDLPKPTYTQLEPTHPYQFEYNQMAQILPDSFARSEPHWIFVNYPAYRANVQLTYKPINNDPQRLKSMLEDAYKLAGRHNIKAYEINEKVVKLPSGQWANLITLSGEVPSQFQFITTDTTTHFLRGALYFNTATENDSLAPVIDYIKQDMMHMLKTLKWRQ